MEFQQLIADFAERHSIANLAAEDKIIEIKNEPEDEKIIEV